MKMSAEDLIFYCEFSPPKEGEKQGDYTKRRKKIWDNTLTSYDNDDLTEFHRLSGDLFFPRDKPKPGAPRLTGAELLRKMLVDERARLATIPVYFSPTFDAHLFAGEPDGSKHKGLHSLVRLNNTPGAVAVLAVIDRDLGTGTYSARATLRGNASSKASSFFPDVWSEDRVKTAIKEAFIDTRQFPAFSIAQARAAGALSWVGRYKLNGREILIGGLGDGDKPGSGIATAFPEINGGFKDEN